MNNKQLTIGMIGGMSWESTIPYYRIINETVKEKLGGLHSAKILLYSVDFDEVERMQATNQWDESAAFLGDTAQNLQKAGADFIVICTNTMHKVAPQVSQQISIPLLHIAEATANELNIAHIQKVGLLGTKYTMTEDFYKSKLIEAGLNVLIPNEKDIAFVNHVIYDELCRGIISKDSKRRFLNIIETLQKDGAEGVILGCTEIGLLVQQNAVKIPVFDTTEIHAKQAALWAIEGIPPKVISKKKQETRSTKVI